MKIIGALGAFDNLRFSMILEGSKGSTKPVDLARSLRRLNAQSNFLKFRTALLKENEDNLIDRQLKQYYDELILQESNNKLIVLNSTDNSLDSMETIVDVTH